MGKKDILYRMLDENHGYLLTAQVVEANISKTYMAKFIKENDLEKAASGIYIMGDIWPDELFILQKRNHAVIFSGETALYLHGLMDQEYEAITVNVPSAYNASHLKRQNIIVHYSKTGWHEWGICQLQSASGNLVTAYDMERCICDLVRNRKDTEVQIFQTAMKEYMGRKEKNISRLVEYAVQLGIRDEIMKYVEVLV